LEQVVADLFLIGFGIGMIVAAPIGPIGTAALIEAIAGNYTAAFAAMAGCICAEFGLLLIAVFTVVHLNATSLAVPNVVHLSVGLAFLLVGLYYLTARRMSPVGGVTTFLIAFKITLFSPNNLAALVASIVAMGVPARLIKLPYYCVDPSFGCGLIHETFIRDGGLGAALLIGYLALTIRLVWKYKRRMLTFFGGLVVCVIGACAVAVTKYNQQISQLVDFWQFWLVVSLLGSIMLIALWYQYDPAIVRLRDFERGRTRTRNP